MGVTLPPGVIKMQELCAILFADSALKGERRRRPVDGDGTVVEEAPRPRGEGGIEALVAELPAVREAVAAGRPALVHFCVQGTSTRARVCQNMEANVFTVKSSSLKGADIDIGVLWKRFHCSRVDVTAVSAEDHPLFNGQDAPTVLITHPDGRVAELHPGLIDRGVLLKGMLKTLHRMKVDGPGLIARGKALLGEINALEYEKAFRRYQDEARANPKLTRPAGLTSRDKKLMALPDAELDARLGAARASWEALGRG